MSDQVPQLGNERPVIDGTNLINVGGGGGGLLSINGDVTPAQVLSAGAGIAIVNGGGGAHVISVTGGAGVLTINGDNAAAQTIVAGSGIAVTDLGGGAHRIAVTGGAGLVSINGDNTAAQTIVAGTGIAVTDLGGGAHRIAVSGGAGITSINADNTAAQLLQTSTPLTLSITNGGGGVHTFAVPTFAGPGSTGAVPVPPAATTLSAMYLNRNGSFDIPVKQFCAGVDFGGTPVPNGALTDVVIGTALPAGEDGNYIVFYSTGINGIAAQIYDVVLRVNGVALLGGGFSGLIETAGQTLDVNGSTILNLSGGDIVSVAVNHHGGGAGTTTTFGKVGCARIGN